jgi:hypothetical protein
MNSYSLRRSPEKSARAKELAEQTLDSFASFDWGGSGNNTTESLYEINIELQF